METLDDLVRLVHKNVSRREKGWEAPTALNDPASMFRSDNIAETSTENFSSPISTDHFVTLFTSYVVHGQKCETVHYYSFIPRRFLNRL